MLLSLLVVYTSSLSGSRLRGLVLQEGEFWTAKGTPRREVFISELDMHSKPLRGRGRGRTQHSKDAAAVLASSKGAVVEAAVKEDKGW